MGIGCNAAGVTGCRIIDSPRERLIAILTNSLVPCNGRFPTLIMLITLFFMGFGGGAAGSIATALILTGFIVAGILATLGIVFPSLVIISILAGLITNFSDLAWVQNAFAGIQVCVCVLIFNAVIKLLKKSVIDKRTCVIFLLVMTGGTLLSLSPVWFVLLAALAGIVLKNLEGGTAK